jgi:hypothetical protein
MGEVFTQRTRLEAPADAVFRWHARPGAFERLNPPWAPARVVERTGLIESGSRVGLRLPLGPLGLRWVAEHRDYVEGQQFRDVQIEGPFARWEHTHRVAPDGPAACWLEDRIEYALPGGALGALLGGRLVRRTLARTFAYRHRLTAGDLAAHAAYPGPPLHVLVSGASGLVGSALVPFLTTGGHRVTRLVRGHVRDAAARWDPAAGTIDLKDLDAVDAVVHLAGENVAAGRWSAARKRRIQDSRARGTQVLCAALARLPRPPRVLVSASATGFYGDRGDAIVDEGSAAGEGFLAAVCREWEAATAAAAAAGIRVVHLRIGVVLSAGGGALAKMLPPFRLGAGGRVGRGTQYLSWIALDDILGAILHALRTESLSGPVNAVAPEAVTNAEFARTLGAVLQRPALLPVPAAVLRAVFGEMADETLLASVRVAPARLSATGYRYRHPDLAGALRLTLGR